MTFIWNYNKNIYFDLYNVVTPILTFSHNR